MKGCACIRASELDVSQTIAVKLLQRPRSNARVSIWRGTKQHMTMFAHGFRQGKGEPCLMSLSDSLETQGANESYLKYNINIRC